MPKKSQTKSAKRIRQLRESLNATLQQASMLLQTSFVTWCRWEHGTSVDPLHDALLVLLEQAVKKSGAAKVTESLKAAALDDDRVKMLKALVELS